MLALFIASIVVSSGVDLGDPDSNADQLRATDGSYGTLLLSAVLTLLAFTLMAPPLLYLFRAAQARSDRVRGALVGITVAGPIFLAVGALLRTIAFGMIASDFVAGNIDCAVADNECLDNYIGGETLYGVARGFLIAGGLGLGIGLVYSCLWGMRTGLLTRFMGTLGMAVGAATVLFGPPFATVYVMGLGFIYLGWLPGGRPPAWEAGEAIPWPAPGEQRAPGPDPDEPVEGRADEIFPDAAPPEDEPKPGSIADEVDRASRKADDGDGSPQKRKRRG